MAPQLTDLLRGLTDYERLTSDEAVALRGRDFAAISRIQNLKPAFLEKIIGLAAELGIDRREPWFAERVTTLADLERKNENLAAVALQEVGLERDRFDLVRHRLRDLGHAYVPPGKTGKQLMARS